MRDNADPPLDDSDDLGIEYGNKFYEFSHVAKQRVLSLGSPLIGNRPADHMQRDLLLGSAVRHPANWRLRQLIKNEPSWTFDETRGMNPRDRKIVSRVRCFQYDHYMQLAEKLSESSDEVALALDRLWKCWPTMGLFTRSGQTYRDVCRQGHLCPFCLTRTCVDAYESTLPLALCSQFLVSIIMTVPGFHLNARNDHPTLEHQLQFVNRKIVPALIATCKAGGMDGGLVVRQVGPHLDGEYDWEDGEVVAREKVGFDFRLAAVGGVRDALSSLRQLIDQDLPEFDMLEQLTGTKLSINVRHGDDCALHCALRCALAGYRQGGFNDPESERNEGAFTWFPWALVEKESYFDFVRAVKGQRIFDRWGTWRKKAEKSGKLITKTNGNA